MVATEPFSQLGGDNQHSKNAHDPVSALGRLAASSFASPRKLPSFLLEELSPL